MYVCSAMLCCVCMMYDVYVLSFVCTLCLYACVRVWTYGLMDGWACGCMYLFMCVYMFGMFMFECMYVWRA